MNRDTVSAQLLEDVKNYLNITWDDDATDRKVRGLIAAGAAPGSGPGEKAHPAL